MKNLLLFFFLLIQCLSFSQNQNISNENVFDGEPYIAINPNNSQHLVVAWMGWVNFTEKFQIKLKSSIDGGETWSTTQTIPHMVSGYTSADPSLEFGLNNDVYVCYIDFTGTTPPITGAVYISKSADGGISWNTPKEVINTNYDGTKWPIDRPWMKINTASGPTQGFIYVSSMNGNRTNPSYNPYLSVSSDDANSFSTRYIDTTNWLAGSIINVPMCSPALGSDGTFYGSYPSYVLTQNLYPQLLLAKSEDGGNHMQHSLINIINDDVQTGEFENAKKGGLLIANPADENHLASIGLRATYGDLDVFLTESFDAGDTWTAPLRINDDPIANNRMQDMVWGDFDQDGDLVISWRDRRNGDDSTYQTSSEIWAAYRSKDSIAFSANFEITDSTAVYDTILESSGNDFMCIKMQDDTINAVWGETRSGKLNIWFQRMTTNGKVLALHQIASENIAQIKIFPNPVNDIVHIETENLKEVKLYKLNGKLLGIYNNIVDNKYLKIDLSDFPKSNYFLEIKTKSGTISKKISK